jgi:hypothetical protein
MPAVWQVSGNRLRVRFAFVGRVLCEEGVDIRRPDA